MTRSVAFVGAGPTTIYTLHALLQQEPPPFELTLFEKQASVGRGTTYRPGWNDPAMLFNIASVEIPPLEETLVDWLHRQSDDRLLELHIDREQIDDRVFYPRVLLGEYFYDQLQAMLERATCAGVKVNVRTRCEVIDAISADDGMTLVVRPVRGDVFETRFDHVVLATGHQWPDQPEARPGYFLSPWPASEIEKIPACRIGIRGSSLTAIDAAVVLAVNNRCGLQYKRGLDIDRHRRVAGSDRNYDCGHDDRHQPGRPSDGMGLRGLYHRFGCLDDRRAWLRTSQPDRGQRISDVR